MGQGLPLQIERVRADGQARAGIVGRDALGTGHLRKGRVVVLFLRAKEKRPAGGLKGRDLPQGIAPARVAEWAGEIERAASSTDRSPSGVVRVAAAPGVAFDFLAPFAAWLRPRYPLLRLEVLSSVHYVDLQRREADLALRMRAPASQDLVAVASLQHGNAAFATREYAAGLPRDYGLADVGWICWAAPYEDTPPNPQLEALIPGFVPAFTSDNFLVQWRAAEAGLGAIVLGHVRHRFAAPTALVPLELDLGRYSRSEMHLVCACSALDTLRVRVVADLLADELKRLQTE